MPVLRRNAKEKGSESEMKKPRRVNWGKVVLCPCGAQMVRVRVAYPKCKTEFNAWLCPHEYRIKRKVGDSPPKKVRK